MTKTLFGKMPDGREVYAYTLSNRHGASVTIINLGAIVQSLNIPDSNGQIQDIVLGFDSLEPYLSSSPYFGAIVGRFGNRIANGRFALNGTLYPLKTNNGDNHLHGGEVGFDKKLFDIEEIPCDDGGAVRAHLESPDGEEGYPGRVDLDVEIQLTDDNGLKFEYRGTTDKTTILNPTHHSYFNLSGNLSTPVLEHLVRINAERLTPVNASLIPTGELAEVEGTPFDFREEMTLGSRIDQESKQLTFAGGYDHNFVLSGFDKGVVREVACVREPLSGRTMTVYTDQPGMQLYSGNFLDGTIKGKGETVYPHRCGLCLETQGYPDSPNQPDFPSVVLNPDETYRHVAIYQFGISK